MAGERGSPDTWRDPRGFALKFYTSEGNYDMVGNNTQVFFVRDPMKFQHFIRSQKRRADNDMRDHDMQWDFWTLSPESAHQVTWLMGDRGIPKTWRHMNGYSSHTYMWVNAEGERFWVKYHFKTDQGIDFLTQKEADRIAGEDGDYHRRGLRPQLKGRTAGGRQALSRGGGLEGQRRVHPRRLHPARRGRRLGPARHHGAGREVLDDAARDRLVSNIVGHLKKGVSQPVLERAFEYWRNVDKDLGDRVAKGVNGS